MRTRASDADRRDGLPAPHRPSRARGAPRAPDSSAHGTLRTWSSSTSTKVPASRSPRRQTQPPENMRTWLAATLVFLQTQAGPPRQSPGERAPVEPIARMKAWFAAVERHEPGRADAPAVEIAAWSPIDLHELSADLVIFLGRIDGAHLFKPRARPRPRSSRPRPRPVVEAIRALAGELLRGTGPEASNQFLKRAALLHADVAMLVPRTRGQAPEPEQSAEPQVASSHDRAIQSSSTPRTASHSIWRSRRFTGSSGERCSALWRRTLRETKRFVSGIAPPWRTFRPRRDSGTVIST